MQRELLSKKLLFGSVNRTWKWFQREHPMEDLMESTFKNHFRRHVEEEDYDNLVIPSSDHSLDVGKTNTLYDIKTSKIDNPVLEMISLYFLTAGRVKELKQRASIDEDTDQMLLKYISECRQQLKLIGEVTRNMRSNSRDNEIGVSPSAEGDHMYPIEINLEDPVGELERLQKKDQQKVK